MTPKKTGYSEDELVEQPAIQLFGELEWETANCYHEFSAGKSDLGRENMGEVVLVERLRPALMSLNPDLPSEAIDQAIEELTRDRSVMGLVQANREIYDLIKDGVRVKVPDQSGDGETDETVRVVDWNAPEENDFFLASQFWVSGEYGRKRADLVGFVNGLPLLFIELKASHKNLKQGYDKNLSDYKDTIPQLLWFNSFIILSNGSKSLVGSVTAEWGHFAEWKRISKEKEPATVSLETVIRGTCDKPRFLDLVENFVVFQDVKGGTIKIVAKNHQYLGVNNAIDAVRGIKKNKGKLGVFWHTQGSGKSVSMIFFAQKVLRKTPGNWTFVVVTDRDELDTQIYKEFSRSGAVTEKPEPHARSAAHLRQLLGEDHRYIFTLIHKFRTEKGEKHPVCSERDDVIVIADEAHRTQYDTLAMNMRTALPNAAFIAFTGTPLITGEEKTKGVFGDYVSIYNFKQSADDKATVPLYYENRTPELHLTNPTLNEDIYKVIEEAELDEEQERKLERELGREYHLITRDDRLDTVAEDIVSHFMGRGFQGKAMVVCIDKATAIRMHDKVREQWKRYLSDLKKEVKSATGREREVLEKEIAYMEETDMAVVVSPGQNEIEEMKKRGLDIRPHRKRMVNEELDEKFKDPKDPFRLVFVCAMWMTGFDVPNCSTIYLDKPMRNHTLMQTIARANRVFPEKENGLIVDYANVFRNLQKALAIYGSESGGGVRQGDLPVEEKEALRERLREAIEEARGFCTAHLIDLDKIIAAEKLDQLKLLGDAVEALLVNDETKHKFFEVAGTVAKLYRAILPDVEANEFAPVCTLLAVLVDKIRAEMDPPDISAVMGAVENVLDRSVATEGYVIHDSKDRIIDLSKIDFEALSKQFKAGRKHTMAERLRASIRQRVELMVRLNRTRMDYLEKFKSLIDDYNSGAINVEVFFDRLVQFAKELSEEEQRTITEHLSEEELAVFDLLTRPELKLTKKQRADVKKVARDLLATLKRQKIVLDWRKRQQTRAQVRLAIEETLDRLPKPYTPEIYEQKCELIFQHVFESYYGPGRNLYESA